MVVVTPGDNRAVPFQPQEMLTTPGDLHNVLLHLWSMTDEGRQSPVLARLREQMRRDPAVFILGEDVARHGGGCPLWNLHQAFRTRGLENRFATLVYLERAKFNLNVAMRMADLERPRKTYAAPQGRVLHLFAGLLFALAAKMLWSLHGA